VARGVKKAAVDAAPVGGPWELPDGWRWERLGAVVEKSSAKHLPDADSKLRFVGLEHVPPHQMVVTGHGEFRDMRSAGSAFRDGDVLYGRLRPYLNKVWKATFSGACSGELLVLRPKGELDATYLSYVLHGPDFVSFASASVAGDRPRMDFTVMAEFPVPVPPLQIQRAIVAQVDELLADVGEGELALARANAGVETYQKSLLKAAVTGDLTAEWRLNNSSETGHELLARLVDLRASHGERRRKSKGADAAIASGPRAGLPSLPTTWTWALLPQLGDFGRGKSKHRPRNDPRLYGGRYPFIQTGIVAGCSGVIDRYDQTYSDFGLQQSKLWPAGTVCITIAANIAMTGILGFDACFPDSLVGLTCFEGVRPEYVELFIRTVQQELELYAPATAQKNINLETLYQLAVPLPPTAEQDAIVEIAHKDTGLDNLFDDHLQGAAAALRQSILAAAFRGDLVA
jgi:type I restriction enzyme S subunit